MQENPFSDTKVSLTLGGETYLLTFGLHTMRRIEEAQPDFSLLQGKMPAFEILPFLIKSAIAVPKWTTEDEFIQFYDECTDEENLSKVLLAYQNAVGFIDRRFTPVMEKVADMIEKMKEEDEKAKKKKR